MSEIVTKDLILLAGRDSSTTFSGENIKFLLEIGGTKIIELILNQVEQSLIEKIIIVGPISDLQSSLRGREKEYHLVEQGKTLSENILKGLEKQQQVSGGSRAVVSATDLPFLSAETLNWMASLGDEVSSEIFLPIVLKKTMLALSEFYETFYWPMSPEPFKWGDASAIHVDSVGSSLIEFTDDYRNSWSETKIETTLKRIGLLFKAGGIETASLLAHNYLSKLIQQNSHSKNVPFSKRSDKGDYEKALSLLSGMRVKLVESPNIDLALDLDNEWRQSFFNKRDQQIRNIMLGHKQ